MKKVVILSGGLDSTVLLYRERQAGHNVMALSVSYGQRHVRELAQAALITGRLNIPHTVVDLSDLARILPGSSLTDNSVEVPEGHYAEESMKATVVPNRNMILLSVAVGHAIAHGAKAVCYGAHAGDHAIYPDCRGEFVAAMRNVVRMCDWKSVELEVPFLDMRKEDIVLMGHSLDVPMGDTWSCYKGGLLHCGKCGTCVERREAFTLAHQSNSSVADPTVYLT